MNPRRWCLAAIVLALLQAEAAWSHGTPMVVGQSSGKLAVSGGYSDGEGFAAQFFVEDDEDGDPFTATLPNIGPAIIWSIPGFNINGLNNQSSWSIEVLPRPVQEAVPPEERILWYWNPQTEMVEPATASFYLLGTEARYETLLPTAEVAPPPFLLTATLSGHQGSHNHDLLSYAQDNSRPPAPGAYGFFARLISNLGDPSTHYEPSDPFLLVFNHGVDHESMVDAALAINATAAGTDGDFNHDGLVDAADYVVWRKSIGTAPEYETWRSNFGIAPCNCEGGGSAPVVPEPHGLLLALTAACMGLNRSTQRRRIRHRGGGQLPGAESSTPQMPRVLGYRNAAAPGAPLNCKFKLTNLPAVIDRGRLGGTACRSSRAP
jgi:hypothetical protein